MKRTFERQHLLPLIGLTCATFIFNTSEFIPIGLLTDIAADFAITEAEAGMVISVYAWMVMLLSLPLMIAVSKAGLRKLMLAVIFTFVFFQGMTSISTSFGMLMAARIGVACAHSIFWSIVSPLAVKIVPDDKKALALSIIVTGSSLAMILGMPIGRIVGLALGWRYTFLCIGIFSLLTFVFLFFTLPKTDGFGGFSYKELPVLFKNKLLTGLYISALVVPTAHFVGYSYIEPFMKQIAGIGDDSITLILMFFGIAGIIGSVAFSKYFERLNGRFISATIGGIAACLLLLQASSLAIVSIIALCVFWGISNTAFNVAMQAEIIKYSPQNGTSVSMAIFSGIYNLGIGSGTYLGGAVCTHASIAYIGYAGGIIALAAMIYWISRISPLLDKK